MRAQLSIAVLAAGALAVAGCGSSSNDNKSSNSSSGSGSSSTKSTPSTSGGGGSTVNLSETEFKIDPASTSVSKTGKVTFKIKNNGQITHAFNVEGAGIKETKTPSIAPGQSATVTVDDTKAGSLEFYCPIDGHKAQGMKGELKVGSGGGGSSSSSKSGGGGGGGGG